jgi:hypothetical protein
VLRPAWVHDLDHTWLPAASAGSGRVSANPP